MSEHRAVPEKSAAARRVDTLGWALSFIWLGIALLADLGWAWILIGLGVIMLGAQAMLRRSRERTSGLWTAVGVALLGGGLWELLDVRWPLMPVLLILLGVGLLWNALRGRS